MSETTDKILDCATEMTAVHGFDAISYRDLSKIVGIKTSSIHYHFPTKKELAAAVVARYMNKFKAELDTIDKKYSLPKDKIDALFQSLISGINGGSSKICLCAMLCANADSICNQSQDSLREFFAHLEEWLATLLSNQQDSKQQPLSSKSISVWQKKAKRLVNEIEGAMLLSKVRGGWKYLQSSLELIKEGEY